MVPDSLVLSFFETSSNALLNVDFRQELEGKERWTTGEFRVLLLDKQRSALNRTLANFNTTSSDSSIISLDQLQGRLGQLAKDQHPSNLVEAMTKHDEAARLALCQLVLYSEYRRYYQYYAEKKGEEESFDNDDNILQKSGKMNRSKLLEYLSLCQHSLKLDFVHRFIVSQTPLFEFDDEDEFEDEIDNDQEARPLNANFQITKRLTAPQLRVEFVQRLLARAVGLYPKFVTSEFERIFVQGNTEFSNDEAVQQLFQSVIQKMQMVVQPSLSDQDQGGVTRVVSVQYSEVDPDEHAANPAAAGAPKAESLTTEEERIKQIRLASKAQELQMQYLKELEEMKESQREEFLQQAKLASDTFLRNIMEIPPGPERIVYLRNIDPETSKLMTMYKIWLSTNAVQN